jgi:hypothetical protein
MTTNERQAGAMGRGLRVVASAVLSGLAGLLLWFALVVPIQSSGLSPIALLRIPLEALVVVAVLLVLPQRPRRVVAVIAGAVLGPVLIIKILDIGFFAAFDRPFNPVIDWTYFKSAQGMLSDSIGHRAATLATAGAGLALVAVLVFMPLAALRLSKVVDRHRATSTRTVVALGVIWVACAASGVQFVPGAPVASTAAAGLAYEQVQQVTASIRDEQRFTQQLSAADPVQNTPASDLLTGLRGKDVLLVFVESYGQVAVRGSSFSPQVDAVLTAGNRQLAAAGYSARSGFLTSPTFGGISWLAHSTMQSGLWVDNQMLYDRLVKSDRFTLSDAFRRAGWRTVDDIPADNQDWPPGRAFYHYDHVYNSLNVGYAGPKFSWDLVPDQYTLSTFRRLELAAPHRAPVFAEIDLMSSHTPWAPLPHMVGWNKLGDGSIFDGMPEQGQSPTELWHQPAQVRSAYGTSIRYSLTALLSFLTTYPGKNLVLVVLGDHQPASIVSGQGANHEVPISIISHDPAVLQRISPWGWQVGLLPGPTAPDWPMDAFRNRFLTAYGPHPPTSSLGSASAARH